MRYVSGDILKQGEYIVMIDFPRRNRRGQTNNYEFQGILIDELDIEKGIIKKGREITHFFLDGEWELIARTKPEIYKNSNNNEFKVGQILEHQGYYKSKYEILKIEYGIVYLKNYDGGYGEYDYTIGELKNDNFKIIGMKPEPKIESPEEVRRIKYNLEMQEYRRRKEIEEEIEWRNTSYYPRVGDMDSFGNY